MLQRIVWLFLVLNLSLVMATGAEIEDDTICSPQEFTNKVYQHCIYGNIDSFLEWVNGIDNHLNKELQESEVVIPLGLDVKNTEYLRSWKDAYYAVFQTQTQRKAFLLAGEYYPYLSLLQSTAYAFHELSAVVRICILLSGKQGCPEAENILMLENPTSEFSESVIENRINEIRSDKAMLIPFLKTPFVWNNIKAMTFLKEEGVWEYIIDNLSRTIHSNPFIYINAFFLADELNHVDSNVISWLSRAHERGSALASMRLIALNQPLIEITPVVLGNISINQAHIHRYGEGVDLNRHQANIHYHEALLSMSYDPFLHMEIAEFYADLYMANSNEEIAMNSDVIQNQIFVHLKEAHVRGDGEAALIAIKFLTYLHATREPFVGFNDWNLPKDNHEEALTCLYEYAYLRQEDPIYISRIKELGQRTPKAVQMLERKAIRSIAFRASIIRWGY